MKLSRDAFEETVHVAREYLQAEYRAADEALLCRDFAAVIVQAASCCMVGVACDRHGGAVHGQEAEELRAGVEQLLRNTAGVREDEAAFVLPELRKSLIFLLDHVDARDSLTFREATDPTDPTDPTDEEETMLGRLSLKEH